MTVLLLGRLRRPSQQTLSKPAASQQAAPVHSVGKAPVPGAPFVKLPTVGVYSQPAVVVEGIELDKKEACYGEENFATIRAHDLSGDNSRLVVSMTDSDEVGFRVPFRVERGSSQGRRRFMIRGADGPPVFAPLPPVVMKECDVARRVAIRVSLQPRSPHVLTLTASVSDGPATGEEFRAASYEWQFGDGATQKISGPEVEHSYEGVPNTTRFSYFAITVKVTDEQGRSLSGSRSYGFANFGFSALVDEHRVLVFSAGGSLAGESARGGERVRLYHGYEGTVVLERVRMKEQAFPSGGNEMAGPEYTADAALGFKVLQPGRSTSTLDLSRFRPTEPNRVRVLEIIGSADGMEARGRILLSSTAKGEETSSLGVVSGN